MYNNKQFTKKDEFSRGLCVLVISVVQQEKRKRGKEEKRKRGRS